MVTYLTSWLQQFFFIFWSTELPQVLLRFFGRFLPLASVLAMLWKDDGGKWRIRTMIYLALAESIGVGGVQSYSHAHYNRTIWMLLRAFLDICDIDSAVLVKNGIRKLWELMKANQGLLGFPPVFVGLFTLDSPVPHLIPFRSAFRRSVHCLRTLSFSNTICTVVHSTLYTLYEIGYDEYARDGVLKVYIKNNTVSPSHRWTAIQWRSLQHRPSFFTQRQVY